ncbi:hypothetical protein NQZ71_22250 (plasmid) [Niallia taxi]|uniref:hypothetical protein n=1 Tax=Niallia taxi TaxID=2499688 RepID=UPI002934DACF|nr:hypothetical protein [Niallia taxi]WOD65889.1 hypothetical protein NQZ71_22250 [Niallia taxi]
MSSNYIDFEVVKKMISDQEMTKRRNSIKHNKKAIASIKGEEKVGTVIFSRKAEYKEPNEA